MIMEDFRASSRNIGPVCSCPEWDPGASSQRSSLTRRGTLPDDFGDRGQHFDRPPSRGPGPSLTGTLERPQSRMSTLERPNSRQASGQPFERPCSRSAVVYERPASRCFERPGSRIGSVGNIVQYERPSSRTGVSVTGGYENRVASAVVFERPPSGFERREVNLDELRTTGENRLHPSPSGDYEQSPQVHSVCCAEWENGLGPQSEWDIDVDIRQHIQQCTCTCNHMGYGNYMDYQVSQQNTFCRYQ